MSAFNDNIRLIRGLTGLTQPVFARLIKSNESNIKTWETTEVGTKNFLTLQALSELTGVSVNDLKDKKLSIKDIAINVEMVEKVKVEPEYVSDEGNGHDNSIVSEPSIEYKRMPINSLDFLAGRLAEKDATIEQIEKRIQDALSFAKKMEAHYLDSKSEKDRLFNIIEGYLKDIHSNSNKAKEAVQNLRTEIIAEHGEMMETMDQIAGNKPGTTASKAGILEIAHRVQKTNKGKKAGTGK